MTADKHPDASIFFVESQFQVLARRPGGVSREQAIERAQAKIDEIKPDLEKSLDGELDALGRLTRMASSSRHNDSSWVAPANDHSRQIRDLGAAMGFRLLTFVANNLCEIFDAISKGADYRSDLVDCHIEALTLAQQEQYRDLRPDQLPELSAGLRRALERVGNIHDRDAKTAQ